MNDSINTTTTTTTAADTNCPVCGEPLYMAKNGSFKECRKCGYRITSLPFTFPNVPVPEPEDKPGSFGLYGWICPKCGAVMSPFTDFCPNCTNRHWEITCTTTGTADISKQSNIKSDFDVYNFIGGRKDKLGYE
jgi:ribosomal protein S27AE